MPCSMKVCNFALVPRACPPCVDWGQAGSSCLITMFVVLATKYVVFFLFTPLKNDLIFQLVMQNDSNFLIVCIP